MEEGGGAKVRSGGASVHIDQRSITTVGDGVGMGP